MNPRFVDPVELRQPLLTVALLVTVSLFAVELVGAVAGWWQPSLRIATLGSLAALLLWETRRAGRVFYIVILSAVLASGTSLLELASDRAMGAFDPASTIALLVVLGFVIEATASERQARFVISYSTAIALYTIASVVLEDSSVHEVAGRVVIGVPVQFAALWLIHNLMTSTRAAHQSMELNMKLQGALATCSELLLTGSDDEAIGKAIAALLDATEADYVYVDVNAVDSTGRRTWEILYDAEGPGAFDGPAEMSSGTYDEIDEIAALLAAGQPAHIVVAELERGSEMRSRYEREGVVAELAAPIMIDGSWVGSIGFSEFRVRRDGWSKAEIDTLMRAADMIAAHWTRQRARDGLIELNEARSRFVASVSHELRTPLTAVVGFATELADNIDEFAREEIVGLADIIRRQSNEVTDLVNDLLTLERSTIGGVSIDHSRFDVREHILEIAATLDVPIELEPGDVTVWADLLRVRQIVRNMLTNAARYGGSRVVATLDAGESSATICIADDGAGISSLDAERIFDEFERLHRGMTMPDSVGLGLAVARRLARLMDGDLVYLRDLGWTRFELTLPTTPPDGPGHNA